MNVLLLLPLMAGPLKFLLWLVVILLVLAVVFAVIRRRP